MLGMKAPSVAGIIGFLVATARADGPTEQSIFGDINSLFPCEAVAKVISNASTVYYPGSSEYTADVLHWSSTNVIHPACSVEPGTPEDVGAILRILASSRTPFAVKGGGHNTNPGFSSTEGVHISMSRFNDVIVNSSEGTVDIGAGLIWDDVYAALDGTGVNVVGGRIPGVGVAGFMLGGGFSWKTSQYGLGIDTVKAFELVLPDGTITNVTEANKDLWFALRGGLNNFGIVTKFTLKTYPETEVWAGMLIMSMEHVREFNAAVVKYCAEVTDKKAALAPVYTRPSGSPATMLGAVLFYDGPSPPAGVFDEFLAIPTIAGGAQTGSFLSFIMSMVAAVPPPGGRRSYSGIPVLQYSASLIEVVRNETVFWGDRLTKLDPTFSVTNALEPFDPTMFSYGAPSAYPPDRSRPLYPTNLFYSWTDPSLDPVVHDAIWQSTKAIEAAALAEGQELVGAATYPNYALHDKPLEGIYGKELARLKSIKRRYDPQNVMGLAGGFKL